MIRRLIRHTNNFTVIPFSLDISHIFSNYIPPFNIIYILSNRGWLTESLPQILWQLGRSSYALFKYAHCAQIWICGAVEKPIAALLYKQNFPELQPSLRWHNFHLHHKFTPSRCGILGKYCKIFFGHLPSVLQLCEYLVCNVLLHDSP